MHIPLKQMIFILNTVDWKKTCRKCYINATQLFFTASFPSHRGVCKWWCLLLIGQIQQMRWERHTKVHKYTDGGSLLNPLWVHTLYTLHGIMHCVRSMMETVLSLLLKLAAEETRHPMWKRNGNIRGLTGNFLFYFFSVV